MMHFHINRKLTVLQSFNDMQFPQWTAAIQERAVKTRHQCKKLAITPWLWQGRMSEMIVKVEMIILLPVHRSNRAGTARTDKLAKGAP